MVGLPEVEYGLPEVGHGWSARGGTWLACQRWHMVGLPEV